MSTSNPPPGAPGPVNPGEPSSNQTPEQPITLPSSGSLYDQPTAIGSQLFPSSSGPIQQAPFSQPWSQPSGPLSQMPGSQPWPSFESVPTLPGVETLQTPSGPLPVSMPSGPLSPATPGAVSSSPGTRAWSLSFALFGVVLAAAGGVFFSLTPGPSPAFASEQNTWAVNPIIGLPTLIAGLLLLILPFVLSVALKPFARRAAPAASEPRGAVLPTSGTPSLPPASGPVLPMTFSQPFAPASGALPLPHSQPPSGPLSGAVTPQHTSQPFAPASGPMPLMPGSQPLQPLLGPLPQPSSPQPWQPSGPLPTALNEQPLPPASGPLSPMVGEQPMLPSGSPPQLPPAPAKRKGFPIWLFALALIGLLLAISGGAATAGAFTSSGGPTPTPTTPPASYRSAQGTVIATIVTYGGSNAGNYLVLDNLVACYYAPTDFTPQVVVDIDETVSFVYRPDESVDLNSVDPNFKHIQAYKAVQFIINGQTYNTAEYPPKSPGASTAASGGNVLGISLLSAGLGLMVAALAFFIVQRRRRGRLQPQTALGGVPIGVVSAPAMPGEGLAPPPEAPGMAPPPTDLLPGS